MSGFGEALRLERERRGISLDALSAETKVQPRHFMALEENAFGELPGGVFRRGILRAYLHALQLEEQEWIPRFDESVAERARVQGFSVQTPEAAWVEFAENVSKNRLVERRQFDWRWLRIVLLLLLLMIAGWAVWHFELRLLVRS